MVRRIAKAVLILGPRWRLTGAPGLDRTDQNRGGHRRGDEQELLIENSFNRAEYAKDGNQERNWKDRRHGRAQPFADFFRMQNAMNWVRFPRLSQKMQKYFWPSP
jgi:hypothetical protein